MMRIKKLEISGFKSFAERAQLHFGEGITGVVGPNGCGKSNIVDAIRWCMGEMSAKHLRGRAMQDVIFAGSDSHGPQGLAEVTLTFDNTEHADVLAPSVAASQQFNFSEIAVTRRLFRDGTSEYLMNKVPVRLRDVTDLFLGTGVGTRAYSIIEQGRIGFIVNSRPEDRRTLIEEVAGITKFKARKKGAERRMESTEQNLLRVNDVVSELQRQLETLRRQAKKAQRYKELRAIAQDMALHFAAMDLLHLLAQLKLQRERRVDIESHMDATQQGLADDENALDSERERLMLDEARLQEEQAQGAAQDARLAALQRDVAHWREQVEAVHTRAEQAACESEQAQKRIVQAEEEAAGLQSEAARLRETAVADADALEQMRGGAHDAQEALAAVDEELEILRRDALQHLQGAAKQRAAAAKLEAERASLQDRLHQATSETDTLAPRQAQVQVRQEELAARRTALADKLDTWREERDTWRDELKILRQRLGEATSQVHTCREKLGHKRSRLKSLEEIAQRLDGYSDGVRTLLKPKNKDHAIAGLVGLVTEILEVDPACERAIEAVLGERLQYILVRDAEVANTAIAALRAHKGGRGGFIPEALQSYAPDWPVPAGEGILGRALERVKTPEAYAALAPYLLGHVLLVASLPAALALRAQYPNAPWTYVTSDGEVVDAQGVIVGGSLTGAGLLANRREIRELKTVVQELEEALVQCQAQQASSQEQVTGMEVRLQEREHDLHTCELEAMDVKKDAQAAQAEHHRLTERLETLRVQTGRHSDALAQVEQASSTALAAAQAAEAGHEEVELRLAELQERRHIQADRQRQHHDKLTHLQVRLAEYQEKVASAEAAAQRLIQQAVEQRERLAHAQEAAVLATAQKVELAEKIAVGDLELAECTAQADERHANLAAARGAYETAQEDLRLREKSLKEVRSGSERLHEDLTACKMALQELSLKQGQLMEHVQQSYDLDLTRVLGNYHMRPPPQQADKKRLHQTTQTIKNMGSIHLTAIEECAEVEQRYDFLVKQRDDLETALGALRQAIAQINRASRERFQEAFEAVNDMFQKVYPRLFRGGVARLELTHADDILEAGVDIIAMPPGKKLQNVGLLSGGEKALTATALIFAIFLIKPSPFCILDEVDAPLDEANVQRFNDILREISKVSQFIVITHNKQTMIQADRLYGITMQEPGMSKVVSVDLDKKKEQAA